MDQQLAKIRGHFAGTQHSPAILLQAIEHTLLQSNTPLCPTAYNQAILSTLASLSAHPHHHPHLNQTDFDGLYLHAIVIGHLPKPVLRSESSQILQLIHPRLARLLVSDPDNKVPALKSIIAILSHVYLSLSPAQLNLSRSLPASPAQIFQDAFLPLLVAQQPKLRRAAQAALAQIVSTPPPPLASHPYCEPLARFLLAQLGLLVANQRVHPELSISLLISLVSFSTTVLAHLPLDLLENLVGCLLGLPKLNNPFLTTAVFNALEAIFHPTTILDPTRIHATLEATIRLEPTDQKALPAWLGALEHGYTTLARIAPGVCAAELAQPGLLPRFFALFACPAEPVRQPAHSLLVALCRYCLTDADIAVAATGASEPPSATAAIVALLSDGLGDSQTVAVGGTASLVGVFKALVQRLGRRSGAGRRCVPVAAQLLTRHIAQLDGLRARGIGLESSIDDALGVVSQVFGPKFLLDVLPLNLDSFDSSTIQGRAWLLTVLKPFNCDLGHFIETFLPLCESLFERKKVMLKKLKENNNHNESDHGNQNRNGGILLQVKVIETIVEQVWKLFPKYCDLPWDITFVFNQEFAQVLSHLIYTYPNLRGSILIGLKTLIDKTLKLSFRSDQPQQQQQQEDKREDQEGSPKLTTTTITSKNNDQNCFNEFGFNSIEQKSHLQRLGPNFLAVLFNVFCSDEKNESNGNGGGGGGGNKGLVGECIGTFLEILDVEELNKTYDKVKSKLDQSLLKPTPTPTTKINTLSKSTKTEDIKKMFELISIMLPTLVQNSNSLEGSNRIDKLIELLISEELLWINDGSIQKKVMKLLMNIVELVQQQQSSSKSLKVGLMLGDLEGFLDRVIGRDDGVRKVAGAAKRERAQLVLSLVGLLPATQMAFVPRLLTEVVVGCKEANKDTRLASYDALVRLGRRMMEPGARVDWRAVVGEEADAEMAGVQDGQGEAGVEEFFKMVAAGLAGSSPHMISATIAALSRILFEFHDKLSAETVSELVKTMMIFLGSSNREIAKSSIGFMKVCVIRLPKESLEPHLVDLVPGLLKWADEHKNYFKTNIQSVVERMMRKFGEMGIEKFVTKDEKDGGRKLWNGVKRRQARSKKKKKAGKVGEDGEEEEQEMVAKPVRARLGDAYEEALYGSSDSELDCLASSSGRGGSGGNNRSKTKPADEVFNRLVEDGEVEVMDLLTGGRMANDKILDKRAQAERRKEALKVIGGGYAKDVETGKMVIEETEESSESESQGVRDSTNAYLDAVCQSGRNGLGKNVKGNHEKLNKRKRGAGGDDSEDDDDDEVLNGIEKMGIVNNNHQAGGVSGEKGGKKVKRRVKHKLGEEFKAKKANGDQVLKGGMKPYGYLPLQKNQTGQSHQGNWVGGEVDITGKKKGSHSSNGNGHGHGGRGGGRNKKLKK